MKEVTRLCRNVTFSEQLLCILECTMGNYSFPCTATASTLWQETRVFVSLSAELFPCSDSSMAVSTSVKAAAFAALFKPSEVKTITKQKFPYELHQPCGVLHFSLCGCCLVCSSGYVHSMIMVLQDIGTQVTGGRSDHVQTCLSSGT